MTEKTILITGGAGFIGTNFVRHVVSTQPGWHIVNLDALTYAGNPQNLEDLSTGEEGSYQFIHGDIRDAALLDKLFKEKEINGVLHFAAESHVDRSILGPEAFVEANIIGTFRLLEASLKAWESRGRPQDFRFLHISTDEVYGSLEKKGYTTLAKKIARKTIELILKFGFCEYYDPFDGHPGKAMKNFGWSTLAIDFIDLLNRN